MGPLFTSAAVFRDKAKPASGTATAPGIKDLDKSTQLIAFLANLIHPDDDSLGELS
jgi:hypothetical protein